MARMSHNPGEDPLLSDPKRLLLDMAQEHAVPELLRLIVTRLSGSPRVALARIWLTRPTTACPGCTTAEACAAQAKCLELVASGGRSTLSPSTEWTRTDGAFRHMPLGVRKVGRIAATGAAIEAPTSPSPSPTGWPGQTGCGRKESGGSQASRSSTVGRCSACWPYSLARPSGASAWVGSA